MENQNQNQNQNQNFDEEEIRPLIFNYVFHFILFLLIFILHIILYTKIYWVSKILIKLFIFGSCFQILYFILPIFPVLFILIKKFKKKIIIIFQKLTLIFLIVSIIIGLFLSAIIMINTLSSKKFCKECPFSITLEHLNYLFSSYYGYSSNSDDLKDKCKSRRCVLDEVNLNKDYPYLYLCNYDAQYEFIDNDEVIYKRTLPNGQEFSSEHQIVCSSLESVNTDISFINSELYSYINLCNSLTDFYYCRRINKPEKTYNLDMEDTCPENNYLFLMYVLCVLIIIIDIVISMLPWGVEYIALKRILQLLNTTRRKVGSHNSTERSSAASENEGSFKKERTLVLVFPLNDDQNIISVNNNNKKLCIKDSVNPVIDNNNLISNDLDENKNNDKSIIKPIKISQNSERIELNKKSENNQNTRNLINVFNQNLPVANVSTEVNNNQNKNSNTIRIENNNNKK